MSDLKTILLLDVDDKAVDSIVVPANAVKAIALDTVGGYTGPLWKGAQWDGKNLIDPNPFVPPLDAEVTPSVGGGPNVIA